MSKLMITSAGVNDEGMCCTCGHLPTMPFRRYSTDGKLLYGCVDGCHTGHLVAISESSRWHNRQEAEQIRRSQLAFRVR